MWSGHAGKNAYFIEAVGERTELWSQMSKDGSRAASSKTTSPTAMHDGAGTCKPESAAPLSHQAQDEIAHELFQCLHGATLCIGLIQLVSCGQTSHQHERGVWNDT